MSHAECTESLFRGITILSDHFIYAVWLHQASAKPHLPAELPRTLKDDLPSTLLCFTVRPTTEITHTHTHMHAHARARAPAPAPTHTLTTPAPNIWCCEQASLQIPGLVALCDFMPTAGSSESHRHTFCHRFHSNMASCQHSNCIIGRARGTIELFCINGRISLRFPLAEAPPDRDWM